jgi:AcrR family transcriptional regulator
VPDPDAGPAVAGGTPAAERALRTQGRKTLARLLHAGTQVLSEKGFHAARVDDIVRVADLSHGTFYLYFANKEELFRALASECANEMTELAAAMPAAGPGPDGRAELRAWLADFLESYRRYGMVIRGWMEEQVAERELLELGAQAFTAMTGAFRDQVTDRDDADLAAVALLALIERFAYFVTSRTLDFDEEVVLDTVATLVHRGFFAGRH